MCIAYASSYGLTETGMVHHVEVASDPTRIGQIQVRFASLDDDALAVTGPPLQTVGEPNPTMLRLPGEPIG
jgi:hypothetical protein